MKCIYTLHRVLDCCRRRRHTVITREGHSNGSRFPIEWMEISNTLTCVQVARIRVLMFPDFGKFFAGFIVLSLILDLLQVIVLFEL